MDWTYRLRLRNLEMLLSLAETGNMSLSAAMLNTTQPGLSKWLKDLEGEIGLPLFERQARGLRPTPYGDALIGHARRLQAQLDVARDDLHVMRQGGSGMVVVGTSGATAADTVPMALIELLRQRPTTQARVIEATMDSLMTQLSRSEVDIVVGRSAPDVQEDVVIKSQSLFMETMHFVAHSRHPLFSMTNISWSDLLQYRWIVWPRGTPIRNALESALKSEGLTTPAASVHSNSTVTNLTLLSHSNMVGLLSHRTAKRLEALGLLRIVPFRLPGVGSISMYWREDTLSRPAVAAMLDCLRWAAHGHAS